MVVGLGGDRQAGGWQCRNAEVLDLQSCAALVHMGLMQQQCSLELDRDSVPLSPVCTNCRCSGCTEVPVC